MTPVSENLPLTPGIVDQMCQQRLQAYRAAPHDVREHFGIEESILAGGYGYRQLLELVQNGADAILEGSEGQRGTKQTTGRIEVVLAGNSLYVANTGAPLDNEGVEALLSSHSSPKRGNQIGRFGIGFKSLLRFGGSIDVVSRGISIRFDPDRCREHLRRELGLSSDTPVPSLRLAWSTSREDLERSDTVLAEMKWATTIVRAHIADDSALPKVASEIQEFPAQFLLFLPVDVEMRLSDGQKIDKRVRRRRLGTEIELLDGDRRSRWRIGEAVARVTESAALEDARNIHARKEVPISWAVPIDGARDEAGRFWAFFPTETPTRLPGILNAPWKLNSDRKSVIQGPWNDALMDEASRLVATMIPKLASKKDPGRPLDAFPRNLDRKDETAARLTEQVWNHLTQADVVANCEGDLCRADRIRRHPTDEGALIERWVQLTPQKSRRDVIHSTCLRGERRSRLEALAARTSSADPDLPTRALVPRLDAGDWFGRISGTKLSDAKLILRLVEAFAKDRSFQAWKQERPRLPVVLSAKERRIMPSQAIIAAAGSEPTGLQAVHPALSRDPEMRRILSETLEIPRLDNKQWQTLLEEAMRSAEQLRDWQPGAQVQTAWEKVWEILRACPTDVRDDAMELADRIRVRCRDDWWVLLNEAFFDHHEVSDDHAAMAVDNDFHENDTPLLTKYGVAELPRGRPYKYGKSRTRNRQDSLIDTWLDERRGEYISQLDRRSSKPHQDYLRPLDDVFLLPGWGLLNFFSGSRLSNLTRQLLASLDHRALENTEFGHSTQTQKYPRVRVIHPLAWALGTFGAIQVHDAPIPLSTLMASMTEPALRLIEGWAEIQNGLSVLKNSTTWSSPKRTEQVDLWSALLLASQAEGSNGERDLLKSLWISAARFGLAPERVRVATTDHPLSDIFVTDSPELASRVADLNLAAITLERDTADVWVENGAQRLQTLLNVSFESDGSGPIALIEAMPEMASVLAPNFQNGINTRIVSHLAVRISGRQKEEPCLLWDHHLLLDVVQMARLSRRERYRAVLRELAPAGWLRMNVDEAVSSLADFGYEDRRQHVANGATLAERLLRAVGGQRQPLLDVLTETVRRTLSDDTSKLQLADLVLAMLGPTSLASLSTTLHAEGLRPPERWGTSAAKAFATSIGFPDSFGGSPSARRDPEVWVSGPLNLPPLHDYQAEVKSGLRALFDSGASRRRAVVSLPTGAGKTRVTVEACVELVLRPETEPRIVLWVAETDELCEQAVQAFRQVWANAGKEGTDLRVVRLWGGNPNPGPSDGIPTVVVASIQTLDSRIGHDDLRWLSQPGLLVVDECHHAIAPSYTGLLAWLDAAGSQRKSDRKAEPPVIGLSATPFRGYNNEESQRLASRFDRRWLPEAQERLHETLRDRGVLAKIDDEAIDSDVSLTPDEIQHVEKFGELPETFNQRLASMADRNQLILDTIAASSQRSILLFANSVDHAEELAARLHCRGIAAACVSSRTQSSARRYFLEEFQRGSLRVLCNQSVLTTGFDAPRTDMIFIARQVLSPVRYMQMVGRGLRGPENGGTARVRIVTVLDNLGRFGNKHPYHFCAQYFRSGS
ncbi:MAG: DEAD/DEAH box helicase [Rhodospirillaceae bacterium]